MRFHKWGVWLLLVLVPLPCFAVPQCTVSTAGLDFGVYSPALPAPMDGIATIVLDCDAGIVYTMEASTAKMNPDGSREMKAGGIVAIRALYFLYIDPARTQVWGDGSGNTYIINGTSTGSLIDIPIYGRVPARQLLEIGVYSDKVLVRVNF